MKNLFYFLTIGLIALLGISSCDNSDFSPIDSAEDFGQTASERYIIVMDVSNKESSESFSMMPINPIDQIIKDNNLTSEQIIHKYQKAILGFSAYLTKEQHQALLSDSRISYIEEDRIFTIEGMVDEEKEVNRSMGQTVPWGINSIGGSVEATSTTGIAWIIDTGIDLNHGDLNVNIELSKTFVRYGSDSQSADDRNGHGTHVAGIIGAKDNSFGSIGVCPNAVLVAVKVLNYNGSGYTSDIIAGCEYVINNKVADKVNVANMSLGGSASTALDNAVKSMATNGILVVVAAGNSAYQASLYSPARVNQTGVFTISAYDKYDKFATFSNYGNPPIEFSAPGVSIYSTYKDGRFRTMSGTSMAAPYSAGILLVNNGTIKGNGTVINDKDNTPDTKAGL